MSDEQTSAAEASGDKQPARAIEEPATAAGATSPRRAIPRTTWTGFLKEAVIVVVAALLITSVTRMFVMQPFIIPSGSMQNTLQGGDPRQPDDRVMAIKFGGIDRGDIVVFEDSARWLAEDPVEAPAWKRALEVVGLMPDTSKNYLVKRAIGLPGDKVTCCTSQGQIEVNGHALDESSYLYRDAGGTMVKPSDFPFEVVVPQGRIFVMGDHRNASADSRCHLQAMGIDAFVPRDRVVGPVKVIMLPQSRWRSFDPPEIFSAIPAPTGPVSSQPVIKADKVTC